MQSQIHYNKNNQPFVVIGFHHRDSKNKFWNIRFIETGYETVVATGEINRGNICDYYVPSVAGVGFVGDCIKSIHRISQTRVYRVWHNMINRCYNPKSTEWRHYGAVGVTVCERWHNLTNFIEDLPLIKGFDAELFDENLIHLDKDKHQFMQLVKVYSLETCEFITPAENGRLIDRERKAILVTDNRGNHSKWESVASFVSAHPSFRASSVYKCLAKYYKTLHGWTFDYCNDYRKPHIGVSRVATSEILVSEVQSA